MIWKPFPWALSDILLVTWMWCKTWICRLYGYRLLSGGGEGMRGRHDFIRGMEMRRKRSRVKYFYQHSFFFLPIVCLKDHQTPLRPNSLLVILSYIWVTQAVFFVYFCPWGVFYTVKLGYTLAYLHSCQNEYPDKRQLLFKRTTQHFSSNETNIASVGKLMKSMRNEM